MELSLQETEKVRKSTLILQKQKIQDYNTARDPKIMGIGGVNFTP